MNIFRSRFLMVASLAGTAGLLMNVNCGSSGGGGTGGSGGTTSTGGKGGTGTGGTTSTGGKGGTGTGGTTSTGGTAGSGTGGASTGGTAGSGTGGSAGASGTGGAGGANTDGGAQQFAAFSYTFDTSQEGFSLNTFNPSTGGNLGDLDGSTKAVQTWDKNSGHPDNGSLQIEATFTGYNQFVLSSLNLATSLNLTGKTVHAFVMVETPDGGVAFGGGAQVEVNSAAGTNKNASGTYTTLTPGVWKELTVAIPATSAAFDATQIAQFSVQFGSGSPQDAAFPGPVHATFHIDTITDGSGLPAPPPLNATFDSGLQGFGLFDSGDGFGDAGAAAPTLTFDSTVGDPTAGSAKLVIPFTGYNQQLDTQLNPGTGSPLDLTGKVLHAKVRLDSGTFTSGYINLHVSGPDYSHYEKATTGTINASSLTAGQWVDLSIDLSAITDTGFDPSHIIQVGLQFGTGSGPEGGAFPSTGQPVTFHIDSIVAQ